MTPTTTRQLREAIGAVLRGLTPSELARRDRGWQAVDSIDDVAGAEIRRFFISMQDAAEDRGGIYSPDAVEHVVTLLIFTNYGSIPEAEVEDLVSEDGRQIWIELEIRRDAETPSTIDGLVSVERSGWTDEDDEQGRRWGAHTFTLRYLAQGIPGAT